MQASTLLGRAVSLTSGLVNSMGSAALSPPRTNLGTVVNHGPRTAKRIALTFDDGPASPSTEWALDALARVEVQATFFCIGQMVAANPDVVRRMAEEGHEVGSHSMDHSRMAAVSPRGTAHLDGASKVIEEVTGRPPTLYRAPWGWFTPWESRRAAALGMRAIGWDVYPDDWKTPEPPAAETAQFVRDRVQPGSIVLLHDAASHLFDCAKTETAGAIELLVPELRQDGYEFVTVGELLELADANPTQTTEPGPR